MLPFKKYVETQPVEVLCAAQLVCKHVLCSQIFWEPFSWAFRVQSQVALCLCLQSPLILACNSSETAGTVLKHTKHLPKQTFVVLSFTWGWEDYLSGRKQWPSMDHQGHTLPRKLLWFPEQPLSALYLCLSVDSFESLECSHQRTYTGSLQIPLRKGTS